MQTLLQTTPDTSAYLIAGYVVIFGAILIYLISMLVRAHNLRRELETLEEIEKK